MIRLGWGFHRPKRGQEAQKASQVGANPLARAIELHQRGVEGDREAVKEAHEILAKMMDSPRAGHRVTAYFGSATALLGRDAVDPNERFALAIKGLKLLDQAVAEEPEDPETRTLRAYVCLRLPEAFFHRTATAVEDFRWLVSRYEADPSAYPADRYHRFLLELGTALWNLDRREEAEAVWRKLLAATGDPEYRRLLRERGFTVPEETRASGATQRAETEIPAEGLDLHRRALAGERGAAGRAKDFFARLREAHPNDPVIQAYYADCLSMTGRESEDPAEMFAAAIKAMKLLDAAVNAAPDDVRVRLLRAGQSLRLPEAFFHRTATAAGDLEHLASRYESDRSLFPEETYRRLLYDLGDCYLRLGLWDEAEAAWKKLAAADPAGEYAALVREKRRRSEPAGMGAVRGGKVSRQEAVRLHDLAVEGSAEAARAALALWERIWRADPGDPEAEAYYGSSLALTGRYAGEPKEIFDKAIKGLIHLNKAAARDWRNPRIRLLRGYLAYSLPEAFFHLTEKAVKDFRFLKSAYERDHSILPREVYLRILRDLGKAYRRLGQEDRAQKVWARLRREDPEAALPPPEAPA
ncbi:MAG: tetratricopeptide repeat protein, partial [Firmicutes bacterium]|nr:tetratricopeptide repeat protein [Bacillota bacterium]